MVLDPVLAGVFVPALGAAPSGVLFLKPDLDAYLLDALQVLGHRCVVWPLFVVPEGDKGIAGQVVTLKAEIKSLAAGTPPQLTGGAKGGDLVALASKAAYVLQFHPDTLGERFQLAVLVGEHHGAGAAVEPAVGVEFELH